MEQLTTNYLTRAEIWLFITILAYFMMNGAQVFETAVIIPKWTSSPPESLALLGGNTDLILRCSGSSSIHCMNSPSSWPSFSVGK